MVKFSFKYKGKEFNLDVLECKSIFSRAWGLMFRKKGKPLLFIFPRKNLQPIHSFFCKTFFAIWFFDDKIIDAKIVKPWKFSIIPKSKFNKLLEIPCFDSSFFLIYRRYRNL